MNQVIDKKSRRSLWIYVIPILLLYFLVVLLPLINSLWYSLNTSINFQRHFSGLKNYRELLTDRDFFRSLLNNFILLIIALVFKTSVGFLIAAMMRTKFVVFKRFVRMVLFFPVVLAPIVVGLIWTIIYDYENGVLNHVLNLFRIPNQLWLSNPNIVMYAVSVPLVWQYIGLYFVIFASGFAKINQDILSAASIDGAGFFQTLFYITIC